MREFCEKYWPYGVTILMWVIVILVICCGCTRALKKENEQLREELTKARQYVPLKRDTIRDTVQMITQQIVEVEKVKEVLSKEDKALLKDMDAKINAIESFQKLGMETLAEVTLSRDTIAAKGYEAENERLPPVDSVLTYKDAWLDLKYNSLNRNLVIQLHDSLAIAVEKEYKKKFLWWRWGTKGYQVKAVSFNPYSTIRYNTYVKRRR